MKSMKHHKAFAPEQEQASWYSKSPFFVIGLSLIYILYTCPLDLIGEQYLFMARLLQHCLIIFVVPHLILGGIPERLLMFYYDRYPFIQYYLVKLSKPVLAFIIFHLVFYTWHIPFLYELALENPVIKLIERFCFISAAIIMWLPLFNPHKALRLLPSGQMLYTLLLVFGQLPFMALFAFSKSTIYPTYAQAQRIISMTPLQDQLIAVIGLKLLSAVCFGTMFLIAFLNCYELDQQRHKLAELYTHSKSE